jgi:NAD(P)-dependent dehydrogenase (short-subunit alcohol dehydrogenase family)
MSTPLLDELGRQEHQIHSVHRDRAHRHAPSTGCEHRAIAPGPAYTQFNRRNMAQRAVSLGISEEEMIERVRNAIPLGRWGKPFDMASCVLFLCSPAASPAKCCASAAVWKASRRCRQSGRDDRRL